MVVSSNDKQLALTQIIFQKKTQVEAFLVESFSSQNVNLKGEFSV
jgi:hypothetical protein